MAFETLAVRAASAVVLAPLFVYVVFLGGPALALVLGLVALGCVWEFDRLARGAGHAPDFPVACIGTAAIFAAALVQGFEGAAVAMALFPLLLMRRYLAGAENGKAILDSALTLYSVLHYSFFLSLLYLLRASELRGFPAIAALLALVWIQDSVAYLAGSAFGRTPLTAISPKKTWEGTAAGFVTALVATAMLLALVFERPTGVQSLVLLALVCVVAQLGDLNESLLKRNFGAKDSGSLIPGHGGLLDRFDSLCYSAPAMYVLYPWT